MHDRIHGPGPMPRVGSPVALPFDGGANEPGINIENSAEGFARTPEKFSASKTPHARGEPEKERPERREIL